MKKTDTKTLIEAMRILARNIYSEDGVASAAISEAADRLEEMRVQHRKDDDEYAKLWQMYGDLEEECDRLREALTPSADTKAAYMDEFRFRFGDYTAVNVPWTTIKEIMAAIRSRAAIKEVDDE